ncbi:peptidase S51 dipeptidase E [Oceanobacillus arenosus]|uniref:Peptidase S51 dipeptidase E n=1 Tax=Oceanobacillus arenosus TaxID=1229153 RepID=A0A3D8PYI7_9BACI|nr:peptidase S51 dipeptidase E [Oceanobacillus arenosus]
MVNKHLFLFDGSPPFGKMLGSKFADLSLNDKGKIAILFVEREGWMEYMGRYTNMLLANGVTNFDYLPLSSNQTNNYINELIFCTGIIIGGGKTERYHEYIVDTEIGKYIRKRYEKGILVAGFSTGALISPEKCVIPPIDNAGRQHLFLSGLGLLRDCMISVHFTKWNEEENLKKAIYKVKVPIGYGIDDEEGLYFKNGVLSGSEGDKIYIFNT